MLATLSAIARQAGEAILAIQRQAKITVQQKADQSPVTEADLAAHHLIASALQRLTPATPILSEEALIPWSQRRYWSRYWLIDPLDGTREFIQQRADFTVNIALIEAGVPVLGVVAVPASGVVYLAQQNKAWKMATADAAWQPLRVRSAAPPVVVISRSPDAALSAWLHQLGPHRAEAVGSSLKFCLVAEGSAQYYPRFGPTHIWDTAAGHAVARAAGAQITDWQGRPLDYTPRETLLNPGFVVRVPSADSAINTI